MQQNKKTFTVANLASIFHVQNSTIHKHLEANGLRNKLLKSNHMSHAKGKTSKYHFDNVALVDLAKTFMNKSRVEPSKSTSKSSDIHNYKKIVKMLNGINNKVDMIMNHLHISY